jgi:hypothetical protein
MTDVKVVATHSGLQQRVAKQHAICAYATRGFRRSPLLSIEWVSPLRYDGELVRQRSLAECAEGPDSPLLRPFADGVLRVRPAAGVEI